MFYMQSLKLAFTSEEISELKGFHREGLRFLLEQEDKKPIFNAYRLRPEDGISYCNRECNQLYDENPEAVFRLRILTRISIKEFKEIAVVERTKDTWFDEFLIEPDQSTAV